MLILFLDDGNADDVPLHKPGEQPTLHEILLAEKYDFEAKVQRAARRKKWLKGKVDTCFYFFIVQITLLVLTERNVIFQQTKRCCALYYRTVLCTELLVADWLQSGWNWSCYYKNCNRRKRNNSYSVHCLSQPLCLCLAPALHATKLSLEILSDTCRSVIITFSKIMFGFYFKFHFIVILFLVSCPRHVANAGRVAKPTDASQEHALL